MRGYALLTSLTLVAALGVGWGSSTGSKNFPGKWRLFSPSTGCPSIDTSLFAYVYDADNIDGSGNSTITDGALVGTWDNRGSGADATQATGDTYKPVAQLRSLNGHATLAFDGVADYLTIGSSSTGLSFVHETGTFDMFLVLRKDLSLTRYVLANSNTTADTGFAIWTTTADKLQFVMLRGVNGTNNVSHATTFTMAGGEWAYVEFKGDGTTFSAAKNGGAYETSAFANKPFTAGNATRNFTIASDGAVTNTSNVDGAVALILISSAELSTTQRTQVQSVIECRYAL